MATQTYETHAHRPIAWSILWLICLVGLSVAVWVAIRERTLIALVVVVLAVGLLGTISLLRIFVLRVQDRVIRLEMKVRMAGHGLGAEFERLDHRQLIALRFAADDELPALARRAIAEKLPPDQIKRAISRWQGDWYRT